MINPINISTNPIYYSKMPAKQTQGVNTTNPSLELSDYKTGQAILARNNISFRNLSTPIEVTDKYNKKIEDKDHLDLPNVHIYEYPDTNLTLVLNLADKIKNPIVSMTLNNQKQSEYNPIMSNLLKIIINKRFLQTFGTDTYYENEGNVISYFQLNNQDAVKNISQLNKIIFNTKFNKIELEMAKKDLIKYINSDEYNNANIDIKYLYKSSDLKSNNELTKEINSVTLYSIQNYQDNCLKNSEGTAQVIISKNSFVKDQNKILQSINKNIPIKLKPQDSTEDMKKFIPNTRLACIRDLPDSYPLNFNYKISFNNTKESLIGEIAELILTGDNYIVLEKYYKDPIEIRNPKQINTCLYWKINTDIAPNQDINEKEEYKKFQKYVNNIYQSDFANELEEYKNLLKDDYKYDLQENENGMERCKPFLIDEYFQIYELINSITEQDIKNFIRKFIIEQKPVIHINDTKKYEECNHDKTN